MTPEGPARGALNRTGDHTVERTDCHISISAPCASLRLLDLSSTMKFKRRLPRPPFSSPRLLSKHDRSVVILLGIESKEEVRLERTSTFWLLESLSEILLRVVQLLS